MHTFVGSKSDFFFVDLHAVITYCTFVNFRRFAVCGNKRVADLSDAENVHILTKID